MSKQETGERLRQAREDGTTHTEGTMYRQVAEVLNELLPSGWEAKSQVSAETEGLPDFTVLHKKTSGQAAYIEVKLEKTLDQAFKPDHTGEHQIARYRQDGIPVLLTDAVNWFDVTDPDDIRRLVACFDGTDDQAAEQSLRDTLRLACGKRPRYSKESSAAAMSAIAGQINEAVSGDGLNDQWQQIRSTLGFGGHNTLDGSEGGVGEIIAFTLLYIASQLDPLDDGRFVDAAQAEWSAEAVWKREATTSLPEVSHAVLQGLHADLDARKLLGGEGWATIRAVAAYVSEAGSASRWGRLSALWDRHLDRQGRRVSLGSWQTPEGVAAFQAKQTDQALRRLGYDGCADAKATVIDPCVGTGVYLQAVIDEAGGDAETFNASSNAPDDRPRLLGVDISPTAVAATHIRLAQTGARPSLYMTDTLSASAGCDAVPLFDVGTQRPSASTVTRAADWDWNEMKRWAARSADRDPIIAIIGNPPYHRGKLEMNRYDDVGWRVDVWQRWQKGSGGRGSLSDPFVAFWAWALGVCRQSHNALSKEAEACGERPLCGVVSFITNRIWIHGDTFGPMRRWVRSRATLVEVTDFGPGSRAGGAGSWSKQPFDIETGTAIVTLTFDPHDPDRKLIYQRAVWDDKRQQPRPHGPTRTGIYSPAASESHWLLHITPPKRSLLKGMTTVNGVKTNDNAKWITVGAAKDRPVRYGFRALDNRRSPNTIPPKNQLKAGARWAKETVFDKHAEHKKGGGWYAILQSQAAKPGPAIHATRHLPDYDLFKGSEGGKVIRVSSGTGIPDDYQRWAARHSLSGKEFWLYALAAAHHPGYWKPGTARADTLANRTVEIPAIRDGRKVRKVIGLGRQLVDAWSVDGLKGVKHTGKPGRWSFDGHDDVADVEVNGRKVLMAWREARPGDWGKRTAAEYARTVEALQKLKDISDQVGKLIR